MARLVNDVVVRLFLNGDWRDISSDVRAANGLEIQRGRRSEDNSTPPQTCTFTLDNTSGDYTERDPMGQWYGYLGRNTLLDATLRLAVDTASIAVASGWGSTDVDAAGAWTSYAWSTSGGSASDFNKAAGKATHLISAANDHRYSWIAGLSQRDIDFTVTVSLSVVNVTGGVVGADFFMRGVGAITNYYAARVLVQTDESVTIDIVDINGDSLVGISTVSGLTYAGGMSLRYRMQSEGQTVRAKIWDAAGSEPFDWHVSFNDQGTTATTTVIRDAGGFIGIRSLVGIGNTNVPVTFSYDSIEVTSMLFSGEVSEWPQTRDVSSVDKTVEIEAAGILRRLSHGQSPLLSAPRRAIPNDSECTYYWPLEDGALGIGTTPAVGDVSLIVLPLGVGASATFDSGDLDPWLPDGVTLKNTVLASAFRQLQQPSFTAANGWRVEYYRQSRGVSDAGDIIYAVDTNNDGLWNVTMNHSTGDVTFFSPYSTIVTSYPDLTSGEGAWIKIVVQGSGTVTWSLYVNDQLVINSSAAGSAFPVHQVSIGAGVQGNLVAGQLALYHGNTATGLPSPMLGHNGEKALVRMIRLCAENEVSLAYVGSSTVTVQLGPQGVKTFLELIAQCANSDGGLLYEPRGATGFMYRSLDSLYNRTSWCAPSLTAGELSPPWEPVSDDRYLRNRVTVSREYGGTYTHTVSTGRLSTLSPEQGGAGITDDSVTLCLSSDLQLPNQASWRTHLGTIDEERYPKVVIELHREQIHTTNPTLYAKLLDLDVGDQITLANLDATGIYDDPTQVVIGLKRSLTRFTHTLELTCMPASAYQIFTLDSSYLDDDFTTLNEALDTTETGVDVAIASAGRIWTAADQPFDVMVGGERMTVTAVTGASSPQTLTVTRSVNGVVKTHSVGDTVRLADPDYLGL